MTQYDIDLEKMTVEQLRELKETWYERAEKRGVLVTIRFIAKKLGKLTGTGPGLKYLLEYEANGKRIRIYADDYGGYMTVKVNGKQVVNTHSRSRLYVPGAWEELVLGRLEEATNMDTEMRRLLEEVRKRELILQLTSPE